MTDTDLIVWGSDIEQATLDQAAKTARLPFVPWPVALMPDAHVGFGSTVGSVIPTKGAIIPAAAGVDLGCGMIAVETDITVDGLPDDLARLHSHIAQVVPSGVGRGHGERKNGYLSDAFYRLMRTAPALTDKQGKTVAEQFGSLGSGNHFVEVCLDERERVWVVLHSGSRGIGNQLAQHHIDKAKGLMKQYFIALEDPDLAYLVEGTFEFSEYIYAMAWAQEYALANREEMMNAVLIQLFCAVGAGEEVDRINCHHNFTEREHHRKQDVWVTRKGAIRARTGDRGVIPGSMGSNSYIVSGLGNPASYCSCAHGAGRRMSRKRARNELTVDSLKELMGDRMWNGTQGRAWSETDANALLDEHPHSYKDIDQVMADQADLVHVEHVLRQVLNYKGT